MSRANIIKTNFSSGELSPLIRGRVDVDKYHNGVKTLKNFIVKPQGAAIRRSGTYFIHEVKDSSKAVRLQEFEFSDTQAYVLEFGEYYIRIFMEGGVVESAGVPVEIVTPYAEADLDELYFTQSADVLYICHPDYQPRTLTRSSHTVWTIALYEPIDGPYQNINTDEDKTVMVTVTSYRETVTTDASEFVAGDVGKYLEYRRGGDILIGEIMTYVSISEVTVRPIDQSYATLPVEATYVNVVDGKALVSAAVFNRSWKNGYIKVTGLAAALNGWYPTVSYNGENRNQIGVGAKLTMKATTGHLFSSELYVDATVRSNSAIFLATDIDRHIRLNFTSKQVWGEITGFTSTTVVSVRFYVAMPLDEDEPWNYRSNLETTAWRLGAFSTTTGWPSCVIFHEERLVFARTASDPQTLWMSESGKYTMFGPSDYDSSVLASSSITYTLGSRKVNSILWLDSGQVLLLGTVGGEWQIRASSMTEPITPMNIVLSQQTPYGTQGQNKLRIQNAVVFVQRVSNKVRELIYNFEIDSFVASDMTLLSEHILRDGTGIKQMAYQQEQNSIIWCVLNDGTMAGLTYERDNQVFAWHKHVVGGSFGTGNAVIESIACIPESGSDYVYLCVKRTINGSTVRYIEYMLSEFHPLTTTDKDDMYFVDCGLTYSGVAATVITGLDHLEGETVHICGDGAVMPPQVVNSGEITLPTEVILAHVGLQFISDIETLPLEGGGDYGTAQGRTKRPHRLVIRLMHSIGFSFGQSISRMKLVSFRDTDDLMDQSPLLFTGDKGFDMIQDYGLEGVYFIRQDQPYPLNILAIMTEFVTSNHE